MKIDLCGREIRLNDNQPITARRARGLRIVCSSGVIWITVDGEAGDTYLRPGESHTLRGNGLALIESIGAGSIRLDKAPPFPSLQRIGHAALGWIMKRAGLIRHIGESAEVQVL